MHVDYQQQFVLPMIINALVKLYTWLWDNFSNWEGGSEMRDTVTILLVCSVLVIRG